MKPLLRFVGLLLLLTAPVSPSLAEDKKSDPIATLVATLDKDGGFWVNGPFAPIQLPKDAKPEQVLRQAIEAGAPDTLPFDTYKIAEIRQVKINRMSYHAILLIKPIGTNIFLCHPIDRGRWWHRMMVVPK